MKSKKKSHVGRNAFLLILLLLILCGLGFYFFLRPALSYYRAEALLNSGDLEGAQALFASLGDFRDSADRADECLAKLGVSEPETAAEPEQTAAPADPAGTVAASTGPLPGAADGTPEPDQVNSAIAAQNSLAAGDYETARVLYEELGDEAGLREVDYAEACAAIDNGDYDRALSLASGLEQPRSDELLARLRRVAPKLLLKDAAVGDIVTFGAFEQDNTTAEAEAVEWLVLSREGDSLLLISRYCLATRPFNDTYAAVTWETCSLRKWLNEDFYQSAFSDAERKLISLTAVKTPANGMYGVSGGNDTEDHVYLLSIPEAQSLFASPAKAQAEATAVAKAQGAFEENGLTWWWLRSVGSGSTHGMGVATTGFVNIYNAAPVNSVGGTVRPVLTVNLG